MNDLSIRFPNIYKTIIEQLGEEIFVCDGDGNIIFVNPASVEVNCIEAGDLLGRNVRDLVSEGLFSDSSTLHVLEKKEPVSVVQKLKDGRKILATGVPVFDNDGNISLVISTSKDVKAVNQLLNTIDSRDAEIESLREEVFAGSGFITSDRSTAELKDTIIRIAPLDMPILIHGDIGVEKNQAAKTVHSFSKRSNAPLMSLNCFTISGPSLESELFGHEETAPSGGYSETRKGMLELADGGTLLISDIDQMPLSVQRKLHGYLETSQFTRSGGSKMITSDTRIIATTCCDLRQMSEEGSFLKELYFSLNTILLHIPSLSSRPGDIELIARSGITKLNAKYKGNKRLSDKALGTLASYDWPGNIKELEHTLESAYILCDSALIGSDTIHKVLHGSDSEDSNIKLLFNDIIPLRKAKEDLEKQLVLRAYAIYKTTYKAAEALGVNQSTVSKILKKYREEKNQQHEND